MSSVTVGLAALCGYLIRGYSETIQSVVATLASGAMTGIFMLVMLRYVDYFLGLDGRTPPSNAEFLFYLFLDAKNCDALVGDLEERYRTIGKKFGKRRADFWYWTQAIRSVGPIVWAWGKKLVMKPLIGVIGWAIARGIIGHDSWLAVVVEVWRRITG
jgi:hypothetical protein